MDTELTTHITLDELHCVYPPPPRNVNEIMIYRPTVFQLQKKNLSNLDFSQYHIDPRSSFKDSYLENCKFHNARFGFDFDYQVDFTYTYLVGATFPKEGTDNRASGVEIKLDGAILSEDVESMFPYWLVVMSSDRFHYFFFTIPSRKFLLIWVFSFPYLHIKKYGTK